ncbi:MAG: DUF4226 domain-containing protein [Mycobacterium sp.]
MPQNLGDFAEAARAQERQLAQRLAESVEFDRSFEVILRGAHRYNVQSRQRLDAIEAEIKQASTTWPALDTPPGARQFQAYLTGKTRQIHKIVAAGAADSSQRAAQVQALTGRYTISEDLPSGAGRNPKDNVGQVGRAETEMLGFGPGNRLPQKPPVKPDSPTPPPPPPKIPTPEDPLSGLPVELGGMPPDRGPQVPPVKFGPSWIPPEVAEAGTQWINTHVPNKTPAEWMQALSETSGSAYVRGRQAQLIRVLQMAQAGQCTVGDAARSLSAIGLDGLSIAGAVPLAEAPPIAIIAAAGGLADGVLNIGDLLQCLGGA